MNDEQQPAAEQLPPYVIEGARSGRRERGRHNGEGRGLAAAETGKPAGPRAAPLALEIHLREAGTVPVLGDLPAPRLPVDRLDVPPARRLDRILVDAEELDVVDGEVEVGGIQGLELKVEYVAAIECLRSAPAFLGELAPGDLYDSRRGDVHAVEVVVGHGGPERDLQAYPAAGERELDPVVLASVERRMARLANIRHSSPLRPCPEAIPPPDR